MGAAIHTTWANGRGDTPFIVRLGHQKMHQNHCMPAVVGALRKQAVSCYHGALDTAGRSGAVGQIMWQTMLQNRCSSSKENTLKVCLHQLWRIQCSCKNPMMDLYRYVEVFWWCFLRLCNWAIYLFSYCVVPFISLCYYHVTCTIIFHRSSLDYLLVRYIILVQ